jgi:hypothetical protein
LRTPLVGGDYGMRLYMDTIAYHQQLARLVLRQSSFDRWDRRPAGSGQARRLAHLSNQP